MRYIKREAQCGLALPGPVDRGRPARIEKLLVVLGLVGLVGAAPVFGQRAQDPVSATVFIRVIGSVELELDEVWTEELRHSEVEVGTGSGFVFTPYGHVLTNHHVIEEDEFEVMVDGRPVQGTMTVDRIEVVFPTHAGGDGEPLSMPASVEAVDPNLDLAVLSVAGAELPYLALGDSEVAGQGLAVRAYGFPFGSEIEIGLASLPDIAPSVSVSAGSVAARRQGDAGQTAFLQVNAAVNPGNSGGPLVDEEGYVLGVIRLKLRASDSVGFAIPVNAVKEFLRLHGYADLLPVTFMESGSPEALTDKRLEIALPRGMEDTAPSLTQILAVEPEAGVALWVDRIATTWSSEQLEQALVKGGRFHRFEQRGGVSGSSRRDGGLFGFASGVDLDLGTREKIEYAVVKNPNHPWETVLARILGPADQIAFNASIVRQALSSLAFESMVAGELTAPVDASALEWVLYEASEPWATSVPLPRDWPIERVSASGCPLGARLPAVGLSALMPGDFTVSLRSTFFHSPDDVLDSGSLAMSCGGGHAGQNARYRRQIEWLGIDYGIEGRVVRTQTGFLQIEVVAPAEKLGWLGEVWEDFQRQLGVDP